MAREKNSESKETTNDSGLNFEAQLWAAAEQAELEPYEGRVFSDKLTR